MIPGASSPELHSAPPARWPARSGRGLPARRDAAGIFAIPGTAGHGRWGTDQAADSASARNLELDLAWEKPSAQGARPEKLPPFVPFPHTTVTQNVTIEVLVPLRDNEGNPFPDSSFSALEDLLLDLANGFTRRGDVEGAWKAPDGVIYRDRSRLYTLQVPESETSTVATTIEREVRVRFRQLAVYLSISLTLALAS